MKTLYRLLLVAILVTIWVLSDDAAPTLLPPLFPYQDKLLHFLEYAALGFATGLNLDLFRRSRAAALAFGVIWAGLDEVHQSFVPGRDCSIGDFLADCAGLAAGFALCILMARRTGRLRIVELMFRKKRNESGY